MIRLDKWGRGLSVSSRLGEVRTLIRSCERSVRAERDLSRGEISSLGGARVQCRVSARLHDEIRLETRNIIVFTELNDRLLQTIGQKGDGAEAQSRRLVMKAALVQRGPEESEDAADEQHSETSHD